MTIGSKEKFLVLAACLAAAFTVSCGASDRHGGTDAVVVADASKSDVPFEPGPNPKNVPLFNEDTVVDFELEFKPSDWKKLMDNWKSGGECDDTCDPDYTCPLKEYVHCTFVFDGERFEDAACRPRGGAYAWEDEKKPQFTIRFNKWDKDARYRGLRRIKLESNAYHKAPVRDRLAMWVMREAGLDAPRVNHARLFVDGKYFGLYQNIEGVDREFLEDHYADPSGNLYKGGCELKTNEDVGDFSNLWDLEWYVDKEPLDGDHTDFYQKLEGLADIDQILLLMAAETVFPTGDNYSNGGGNFYFYDQPGRGFVVIPWDIDGVFDVLTPPDSDIFEYWGDPKVGNEPNKLRLLLNESPEYKAKFVADLVAIRDGPFAALADRTDLYCDQIRDFVKSEPTPRGDLAGFDADCDMIRQHVADRIKYLKDVLGH